MEQKAKRHLEEELRSELEEKDHVIKALQTKVVLLKSGGTNVIDDHQEDSNAAAAATDGVALIDLDNGSSSGSSGVIKKDSEKVVVLEGTDYGFLFPCSSINGIFTARTNDEAIVKKKPHIFPPLLDKVRRLETLLTKCKESIKANKQKTTALTEVKDSLSKQLSEKEAELNSLNDKLSSISTELETVKKREQEDELQMAQTKMHMHQVVNVIYLESFRRPF